MIYSHRIIPKELALYFCQWNLSCKVFVCFLFFFCIEWNLKIIFAIRFKVISHVQLFSTLTLVPLCLTFDFLSPLSASLVEESTSGHFYRAYICSIFAVFLHEKFILLLLFGKKMLTKFKILVYYVFCSPQSHADTSSFSSGICTLMKTEASLNFFLCK